MNFTFPKDFLFGAASSACQIEAGCKEGGKGEDVGEHFYTVFPEKYFGGDPAKAADFYHLYRKDILDMKELGLKSFRFSISWASCAKGIEQAEVSTAIIMVKYPCMTVWLISRILTW